MLSVMDQRALEREIDRLYQLPLDQFTGERNALAKRAGAGAARVRGLAKPPVAAWAVNQLYWQRRETWDALVAAAEEARRAHKAVLSGRSADIRAAGKIHEDSVEAALKAALALLTEAGHPATDATRSAIATTLRALPADEEPGRLTRALQPGGFEALAGLSIAGGGARKAVPAAQKTAARPKAQRAAPKPTVDAREVARARAAAASAERELRTAEHAAKREEFEVAKATRDERRASEAIEHARAALERAQSELEEAKSAAAAAKKAREAAEGRARRADADVAAARERASSATAALKKYS